MASGRDMSYTSSEMGGQGQYIPPATGYQGRDMSYNNSGEYTNQAQQMRRDEFIDQVSTFPGQNDQGYLQQIKTDEYLNQRNNLSAGQGNNTNILQQTGEGVMHAAQGAARGAANMAQGAAAGAANIAQGAASAVKHTLGMDQNAKESTYSPFIDPNANDSAYSSANVGIPINYGGGANYVAGADYSGNVNATSGIPSSNYRADSDYPSSAKRD